MSQRESGYERAPGAAPPWPFLMTPAEHREWSKRAQRHNLPDLAQAHEELARAIAKIAKQRLEAVVAPPR